MPFRLAARHADLRIQPGTSPPVLEQIPGWTFNPYAFLGAHASRSHDAIRNYLRFFSPATAKLVAAFLDCPVKDVKAHWPADTVDVVVLGESEVRSGLAADLDLIVSAPDPRGEVRLLGPYDDRELLGEWRPRTGGGSLKLQVELWAPTKGGRELWGRLDEQARILADFRSVEFVGWTDE